MPIGSSGNYVNYGPTSGTDQPTSDIPSIGGTVVSFVAIFVVGAPFQGPQFPSTQKPSVQNLYIQKIHVQQSSCKYPYGHQLQIPLSGALTNPQLGTQLQYGPNASWGQLGTYPLKPGIPYQ